MKTKINFLFFALFLTVVTPAFASVMIDYPMVELRALDKSTARTKTLKVKVGETTQYGSLFIKVQSCRKSQPLEKPESASFIQVWEVPVNSEKSEWVFSGWMFASSPALSAMDHAVYDVWVLDCVTDKKVAEKPSEEKVKTIVKIEDSEVIEDEVESEEIESIELEEN